MSKFFKALEQAERDRARRKAGAPETPAPEPSSTPAVPAPHTTPARHEDPTGPTAAAVAAPPEVAAAGGRTATTPLPASPSPGEPSTAGSAGRRGGAMAPGAPPARRGMPRVRPAPAGDAPVAPSSSRESAPPVAPAPETDLWVVPAPGPGSERADRAPARPARTRPAATSATPNTVRLDDETGARVEEHLVSLLFPATFEAEQYRALRHVLEQHRTASGLAVVAVTSPVVGDGKTTTAINLAGALAQAPGARVLLIDADLRRPSVAKHLGLSGPTHGERPGLVDALIDPRYRLADIVESRPDFNLAVVPAGTTPQAPYELLQSPRFAELLEEARRDYHYVVLDTSPLVAVPDGRLITKSVDGFLLVVRAHQTPRKLVEEALGLADAQKLVGLVFNRDDRPLTAYYRGYHRSHPLTANGTRRSRFARLVRARRQNGPGE